jgi:programmed cell death 6-interacting protein
MSPPWRIHITVQVADTQNTTTDEGLKTAAKLFQQAAGVFSQLRTTIPTLLVTGELTSDLWPDTLDGLAALMLAQAQDCFVRKAMADQMKPGVVAKLAQQCSTLYEEAQKKMSGDKVTVAVAGFFYWGG